MKTAFDDWLQQLAAAGKGGAALTQIDVPPAMRGDAWRWPILLAGDWSTATITGSIRSMPDAPSALATLSFTSGTFSSITGYTTWTASLASGSGANSTGALPADVDGDGVEEFPLAVYLTPSGGTLELLLGAKFTLLGKV